MLSASETLSYILILGAALYLLFGRTRKNYPPAPPRYPIIGNLFSLGPEFHKTFLKHGKKYGPISSFKMGLQETVILHDLKLIKEAFNDNVFSGRPKSPISEFLAGKRDGIFQAEGRIWMEQRRFAIRALRDFGFGRKGMESMIMEEVGELTDWVAKQSGRPVCLDGRINLAVVNALWTILTGHRYNQDDPKLMQIIRELDVAAGTVEKGQWMPLLLAYYPAIAQLIPNWSGWNTLSKLSESRQELFRGIIEEHKETRSEDQPRDFIDVYLSEVERTKDPTSSFHPSTAIKSLQSVLSDFFLGGTDTTAVTLNWAILYLIHNPAVEKKLHQELDRVVGNSRVANLTDRNQLPYVEAFIMEVLRFSSMVPLGVGHRTTEDVQFHGFLIPKGTKVLVNLYAVHFEPSIWGDPEVFRPERFLSQDGLSLEKNEALIPFSTGKRVCIAYSLAMDQLFLFLASILQRFDICVEPGKPKPTLEPRVGQITIAPQPYSLLMTERNY